MQTHGYERGRPWTLSLQLLTHVQSLAASFDDDPCGLAGKLLNTAGDLPIQAAQTFEQLDYESMRQHTEAAARQMFTMLLHAQVAEHMGLLTPREVADLRKRLDKLKHAFVNLLDELFEDDGLDDLADAA